MWLPRQFCFLCLLSTYLLHLLLTHLVFLFLPTYQPSFISSFLPSFLSLFLPSFLPFFLTNFLLFFFSSFLPSFHGDNCHQSICTKTPWRVKCIRGLPQALRTPFLTSTWWEVTISIDYVFFFCPIDVFQRLIDSAVVLFLKFAIFPFHYCSCAIKSLTLLRRSSSSWRWRVSFCRNSKCLNRSWREERISDRQENTA